MQHQSIWYGELVFVATMIATLWILGAAAGYPALLPGLGALAYLAWNLYNLIRLVFWLQRRKKTLPGYTPGVWGYIFYMLEVRKRKTSSSKKQIRKLLKAFNTSSRALPDATIVLDKHFVIQWINDAALSLLGMRKSDAGFPVANFIRNPDFLGYLEKGRYDEPMTIPAPTNTETMLRMQIVPYGHKQYLLLARDITRQHRLDQMRRDFIANASHELRTPLTILQGSIEQIETQIGNDEVENKPLSRMNRQCDRMRMILEDLLTLARLEGRSQEPGPLEIISPSVLLRDIVDEVNTLSEQQGGHQFVLDLDESFKLRVKMEDLLVASSNLIINAVRYTPAGGTITVMLKNTDLGARLAISDTGGGIREQHIPRLTERFYRVDVGRSRESGGTGLGLSIVKHALDHYRSELEISSELGKGSTFSFTIPSEFVIEGKRREDTASLQNGQPSNNR